MRFLSHGKLAITMAMADYSQSHSSEIDFKVLIRCVVKGYQECIFKVGDIFTAVKKIGDYGRAFKVVDSKRHLQREVVSVLWPLTSEISW